MLRPLRSLTLLVCALLLGITATAHATQVWSGYGFAFSKAAGLDPNSPAAQDRITANVWITRGNTQGIYNAAQEGFSGGPLGASPAGTEWAVGIASDYANLSFDTWATFTGGAPPLTVGVPAVIHLIADDIYIDVKFDSWGVGAIGGGAFAYHRGVPAAVPTRGTTWGKLKELYRSLP